MKKAFSLFELIIVIVVISIVASFIVLKTKASIAFTNKTKVKSDIALIRNAISKQKTSNTLLNSSDYIVLDDATSNVEGSELFKNILDFPLISTNTYKKELATWIKTSQNSYKIFISNNSFLEFNYEENFFVCKSDISLCKEYE